MNEIYIISRLNHPNIVRYYSSWIEQCTLSKEYYESYNSICSDDSDNSLNSIKEENPKNEITILDNNISDYKSGIMVYIQMEYCRGITLDLYLKKRTTIDNKINLQIILNLLRGVEYLHKMNVIHRDITPKNIFLNNNFIKLGDFGLSTMKKKSYLNSEFGSCLYIEDKVKKGAKCEKSMDIYSLGIIFIELYSLFDTEMERCISLTNPINYLEEMNINNDIKKIISKCIWQC